MIEIYINGVKYLFDSCKAKAEQEWYEKRQQNMMWILSGGLLGKQDKEEEE